MLAEQAKTQQMLRRSRETIERLVWVNRLLFMLVITLLLYLVTGCAATDYRAMMRQAGCNQDRETLTHLLARAKGRITVGQAMYEWQEGERGNGCP